jgi:hypothetical protein
MAIRCDRPKSTWVAGAGGNTGAPYHSIAKAFSTAWDNSTYQLPTNRRPRSRNGAVCLGKTVPASS